VKDICFSNDGRQFLSCAYDRTMKLWDTETGQCIKRFGNGKIPYVVRFHPDADKQHIFLAGMSDKKIIQVSFATLAFTRVEKPNPALVRHEFRGDYPRVRSAPRTS
jgi:WD40 repeat protein